MSYEPPSRLPGPDDGRQPPFGPPWQDQPYQPAQPPDAGGRYAPRNWQGWSPTQYLPPVPPPPRSRKTRNVVLGIVAVLALIIAAAVIAREVGSSLTTRAATKPSAPAVQAAPYAAAPTPSATAPPSQAPPPSASLAVLEAQWYEGPAGTAMQAVESDLEAVDNSLPEVDAGDFSDTQGACQQLATDTATALSAPANPDPNVAQHLSAAYADYQSAASGCVSGIQTVDIGEIEQAEAEMSAANTQVQDALTAIETDCPECNPAS